MIPQRSTWAWCGQAALAALLCASCRADIGSVDIDGVNPADARFAFYGISEGTGADINGDETIDASARVLIVLSDRRSACDDLANVLILDQLARIDDGLLVIINAEIFQNDSEGPLITRDLVLNDEDVDGINKDIDLRVLAFENEDTLLNDGDSGDAELLIKGGLLRLNGEFSATLNGGQEISGSFNARHCPIFDALALQGGL